MTISFDTEDDDCSDNAGESENCEKELVTEIGEDAFGECENLSTATVFQKTKGVKKAFPEDCKITYKKR